MNRYAGGAFSPGLPGGRAGGTLGCSDGALVFEKDGATLSLPLSGLEIERGGTGGRLLYFKHAAQPGVILHTGEEAILREPALSGLEGARKARNDLRGARHFNLSAVGLVFGLLLAIPLGLWLGQDLLVSLAVRQIPPLWEEKMGDALFGQIKSQASLIEDAETLRRFEELAAPLVRQSASNIRLHIADDGQVNAFALPGGHLVFNRGLIEKAEAPEEVLGVLAHEIAHVERRHTLRQLVRNLGLYITLQILVGDFSGALGLVQDSGLFLLQQGYSRGMEAEADADGHAALVRAGISTAGMLDFFERLKQEKGLNIPALLSTHPATEERIAAIRSLNASAPPGAPVACDFKALQDALKNAEAGPARPEAPAAAPDPVPPAPGKAESGAGPPETP
jgi:Zn-dependent protease with chaperone function